MTKKYKRFGPLIGRRNEMEYTYVHVNQAFVDNFLLGCCPNGKKWPCVITSKLEVLTS